ncbi:putative bifunctional diguanylate cyclase/phosphodiesterase [Paraburkholderia aromaticivorans]|nr:bifunctional diguanylate cyclase/phosphodiesterase [Paraburkholderia aromaticivorans]
MRRGASNVQLDAVHHAGYALVLDSLTRLHNRVYIAQCLQQLLKSQRAARVAVLFVNLDGFGKINDLGGYDLGDYVLRDVASRLAGLIGGRGLLGRIGGDGFLIVIDDRGNPLTIGGFAQQIFELFKTPFEVAEGEYYVGVAIGIARSDDEACDASALIRDAGLAMHHAKQCGRSRAHFFTAQMQCELQRRFKVEALLRRALGAGELRLVYQPIVDSASGETVGAEALLRWTSSELGDVAPAEFIPVAEEAGLMESIGDWVVEQACAQAGQWRWSLAPHLAVSVNISPRQFDERFVRHVAACLERSGLAASALQLEITESVLMPDDPAVSATMAALAKLGVKLSIDDFGTGYASLSYLKRFALHNLKIDRSFVEGLPHDHDSAAIAHSLVAMAHAFGLTATAEGVETHEQATALFEMGCDMLQGYFFSRPADAAEFGRALSDADLGSKWCAVRPSDA